MNDETIDTRVLRKIDHTMTAGDLADLLGCYDEDTPVVFESDYGDIGHTRMALLISGADAVDLAELESNEGYSHSGLALRRPLDPADYDEDDCDHDEKTGREVLVLNLSIPS